MTKPWSLGTCIADVDLRSRDVELENLTFQRDLDKMWVRYERKVFQTPMPQAKARSRSTSIWRRTSLRKTSHVPEGDGRHPAHIHGWGEDVRRAGGSGGKTKSKQEFNRLRHELRVSIQFCSRGAHIVALAATENLIDALSHVLRDRAAGEVDHGELLEQAPSGEIVGEGSSAAIVVNAEPEGAVVDVDSRQPLATPGRHAFIAAAVVGKAPTIAQVLLIGAAAEIAAAVVAGGYG